MAGLSFGLLALALHIGHDHDHIHTTQAKYPYRQFTQMLSGLTPHLRCQMSGHLCYRLYECYHGKKLVCRAFNHQAALNSTSPASPESQSFSNLNPVFCLRINNMESDYYKRVNSKLVIHLPHVNEFLQSALLAVKDIHHVHVLLVQPDASHSVIS